MQNCKVDALRDYPHGNIVAPQQHTMIEATHRWFLSASVHDISECMGWFLLELRVAPSARAATSTPAKSSKKRLWHSKLAHIREYYGPVNFLTAHVDGLDLTTHDKFGFCDEMPVV
jgi:hypothetical protein